MLRIVLSVALISACASSGPVFSPLRQPGSEEALIYVYRKADSFGQLVPVRVRVNGREIARLPNNSYTYSYVKAGTVSLDATPWQDFAFNERRAVVINNAVAAGETYYLKTHQEQTGPVHRIYLTVMESEEAKGALSGLRYETKSDL